MAMNSACPSWSVVTAAATDAAIETAVLAEDLTEEDFTEEVEEAAIQAYIDSLENWR
jgi:hypothetical protein